MWGVFIWAVERGLVTILPLLTFNSAAKYLRLSTLGFFQYLSPSISFLVAIFLYNEPLGMLKLASLVLIWASLAINIIYNLKNHLGILEFLSDFARNSRF